MQRPTYLIYILINHLCDDANDSLYSASAFQLIVIIPECRGKIYY